MGFDIDFDIVKKRNKEVAKSILDEGYPPIFADETFVSFVGKPYDVLKQHIGKLEQNSMINFWTFGRYAMDDILKWVVAQIGPCDVTCCTWAITTQAVETILRLSKDGLLRSFRIWIDPRVKVRNPQPLQMLQLNFPVVIAPVHAKVTVLSNDDWKVSVSGSMNFTSNPQPERGIISTIPSVFDNDFSILNNEFSDGVERRKY